ADGVLYVADTGTFHVLAVHPKTRRVRTLAGFMPTGSPAMRAAGDGGPAVSAMLGEPGGMAVSPSGQLYVTDRTNHRVRSVDLRTGVITAVAGSGTAAVRPGDVDGHGGGAFSGDGRAARRAGLAVPSDVAVGPD